MTEEELFKNTISYFYDITIKEIISKEDRAYCMSDPIKNSFMSDACKNCPNHPSNGGTGICHCILGSPVITYGGRH